MSDGIRIYGFETSNNMKVRIALGYKGLDYTYTEVDPGDRAELIRLTGQFLTPVMVHGERTLFDSAAILRYLDANFPDTPRLYSEEYGEMADIEGWERFTMTQLGEVVGMMFFDDNTYLLRKGAPMGERLSRIAQERGILLMMCDNCALERGLAEGECWPGESHAKDTVEGVRTGCFPDLYEALGGNPPDHVITL